MGQKCTWPSGGAPTLAPDYLMRARSRLARVRARCPLSLLLPPLAPVVVVGACRRPAGQAARAGVKRPRAQKPVVGAGGAPATPTTQNYDTDQD